MEISTFSSLFFWNLYSLSSLLFASITARKATMFCFPNVTTIAICACTTSAPALQCGKQPRLASPNVTTHAEISKNSYAQRLKALAFTTVRAHIYGENEAIRTVPYIQTPTLSHACHANWT